MSLTESPTSVQCSGSACSEPMALMSRCGLGLRRAGFGSVRAAMPSTLDAVSGEVGLDRDGRVVADGGDGPAGVAPGVDDLDGVRSGRGGADGLDLGRAKPLLDALGELGADGRGVAQDVERVAGARDVSGVPGRDRSTGRRAARSRRRGRLGRRRRRTSGPSKSSRRCRVRASSVASSSPSERVTESPAWRRWSRSCRTSRPSARRRASRLRRCRRWWCGGRGWRPCP